MLDLQLIGPWRGSLRLVYARGGDRLRLAHRFDEVSLSALCRGPLRSETLPYTRSAARAHLAFLATHSGASSGESPACDNVRPVVMRAM